MKEAKWNCGDERSAKAVEQVRGFAAHRLQAGDRASELSFALAFVAIEMGLHITNGKAPLGVFQTVLQGMTAAVASVPVGAETESSTKEQASSVDEQVPAGTWVH